MHVQAKQFSSCLDETSEWQKPLRMNAIVMKSCFEI